MAENSEIAYRTRHGLIARVSVDGGVAFDKQGPEDAGDYGGVADLLADLARKSWATLCRDEKHLPLLLTAEDGREFLALPLSVGAPMKNGVDSLLFRVIPLPSSMGMDAEMRQRMVNLQKMEAITVLAGGLAHDFNNILTSILGFAQLIRMDSEDNPAILQFVEEIEKGVERSTSLIRQMMTFARKVRGEKLLTDVTPVLKEFCKMFRSSTDENIEVDINLAEALPPARIDTFMLHQALSNVCVNAKEAIGEKRGRITVSSGAMEVDSDYVKHLAYCGPGLYIRITVEDDGLGIDDETIKHIFDPFFTTKPVGEGTGLGLSTVFGIVKEHSGFLDVVSKVGEGTRFSLFFPANPVLDPEEPPFDMNGYSGAGNVLLVDEDRDLLAILARLLENYGYSVMTETDGRRALELVSGEDAEFDVVVINHQLPALSGRELIPLLKQVNPDLQITLMTGYGGAGTRAEGKRFGADEFLEKPILPENLVRTVSRLVKRKGSKSGD